MRSPSTNASFAPLAQRATAAHGLVRWLVVLLLIFDLIGAPWHAHRHDGGIDGTAIGAAVRAGVLESGTQVDIPDDRPSWVHATTVLRVEAGPSLTASEDNPLGPVPAWPAARSAAAPEGSARLAIARLEEPAKPAHRSLPPAPQAPPRRA